jgi:hypothetical protein
MGSLKEPKLSGTKEEREGIPKVQFMKASRAFSPPWDKPVTLHPVTVEAIQWCGRRSADEAKKERDAIMERVRQLASRLRTSGMFIFT